MKKALAGEQQIMVHYFRKSFCLPCFGASKGPLSSLEKLFVVVVLSSHNLFTPTVDIFGFGAIK